MSYAHPSVGYPQPGFNLPPVDVGQPGAYPYPPQPGGMYLPPAGPYEQPGGAYAPPPGPNILPGCPYPSPTCVNSPPVTAQPTMVPRNPNVNCIPGLEYLVQVDQLLVQQKVELLEAFTGFETANKYVVKNSMGQDVYYAVEDTDCCARNCCGPSRPFDMRIMDNHQREIIHLDRPLRCQSCWFPCCLQEVEVTSGNKLLGIIKQNWSILAPSFDILDDRGHTVLKIKGPLCTYSMCGDVEFKVFTADASRSVGLITKQWSGLAKEIFTDADNFGVSFPIDLDVKIKATVLGATFLIDYMFFEKQGNKESDGIGMLS